MKIKISLLVPITLLILCSKLYAQVGIGTNNPAASAALEVTSSTNNKGLLIPRITATQKDAISNPTEGLMIFQTSAPAGFYFYTGSVWKLIMTQTDLDTKLSTADAALSLNTKVDKVTGKVLSSNDYTSAEKTKLSAITGSNTGDQDLSALATIASVALKANATDVNTDLATKVDKVTGKELSSNDYTSSEKIKLAAITGINTGDQTTISGNAGSATKLATARNINGVAFDGSGNITVTADAGSLSGTTLKSTVTGSSLTSVGTLANLAVTNPIVGSITGNAATATTASTVTTNANLTGDVTSIGNATIIADGAITNAKVTDVSATKITGTLAVANGGTGAATAAAARSNLGLENVDNTTDLLKPISTETQRALDLKAPLASPTLTGTPLAPTAAAGTNTTQIATTQFVTGEITAANAVVIPYTGATQAVDLGAHNLTVNGVSVGVGSGAISSNTAIGGSALSKNTTGSNNTANGVYALVNNTEGSGNTAQGIYALEMNTTGSNNTSNGMYALLSNTTGSYNTAIGNFANVATGALTNATAIGAGAIVTTSNTIQLGNTSVSNVITSGTITAGAVTYPNIDGSNGQVLTTNGAGAPTWLTPAAGGIPYTGATSAVDLGAYDLKVNDLTIGKGGGSNIYDNTAIGKSALFSNTTGLANTAIGYGALVFNTTGSFNTANGTAALFANTGGSSNTGNGVNALRANTTGQENTAIGMNALQANTVGSFNTANGKDALLFNTTGSSNTANGKDALYTNTTGSYNTANGVSSLYANTTGSFNTANGHQTLRSNTTGSNNTANGLSSLYANTTGDYNTANGNAALFANSSGQSNTANGNAALFANTTGSANTANGVSSLQANTTGSFNTANGINALLTNTTGANNTAIGYAADVATAALTNATAIGAGAVVSTSNTIQLGADGTNGITAVTNVKTSGTITAGTITYPNTHNSTAGQVLTTDASGIASWNTPSSSIGHYLGEAFGGGIVFYVTSDGLHGLIAETQNLSSKCFWMDAQNEISKSSNHSTAGKLFSDWRLPTANELDLLLTYSKATGLVPGLNIWYYWSSTEGSSSIVRIQGYDSLDKTAYGLKYGTDLYEVRPIRAF